jgi:hypothetical protein
MSRMDVLWYPRLRINSSETSIICAFRADVLGDIFSLTNIC